MSIFVVSQFSVSTMFLDIVFLCVVSVVDRLFWEPYGMAEIEDVHSHCRGQERSIL